MPGGDYRVSTNSDYVLADELSEYGDTVSYSDTVSPRADVVSCGRNRVSLITDPLPNSIY